MATTKPMTAEDLARISDDECRYDLIRGELIRVAPAGWRHGRIAHRIGRIVGNYVEEHGLGDMGAAETGFILRRDPDVVLAPDVSFIASDRLPSSDEQGFAHLAPDLVVEVVSPSDNDTHVNDKMMEYLEAGVQLVWIVYPGRRTVTVCTPDRMARILTDDETLDGGDVLPGFRLRLTDIFSH